MQIIVSIQDKPALLNEISYGFSIASLILVVICFTYIFLVFLAMAFYNAIRTAVIHFKDKVLRKKNKTTIAPHHHSQVLGQKNPNISAA
jgi:hypothetical protein